MNRETPTPTSPQEIKRLIMSQAAAEYNQIIFTQKDTSFFIFDRFEFAPGVDANVRKVVYKDILDERRCVVFFVRVEDVLSIPKNGSLTDLHCNVILKRLINRIP